MKFFAPMFFVIVSTSFIFSCKPRQDAGSEAKQLKVVGSDKSKPLIYWTAKSEDQQEFVCRGFCDPKQGANDLPTRVRDVHQMRLDCRVGLKVVPSSWLARDRDVSRLLPAIRGTVGLDGELELSSGRLASRLDAIFDRPGDNIIDDGTVVDQKAFGLCYSDLPAGSGNFQVRGDEGRRRGAQILEKIAGKRPGKICCHAIDPNGKDRYWFDSAQMCLNNTWKTKVIEDVSKCDHANKWICCEVNGSQFTDTRSQCEGNLSGGRVISEERCKR